MGYESVTEAAQWLVQAACRVVQRWARHLAAAGGRPEAISGVRSAFALREQLADSSESVLREAEGISSLARRRKSATAQSHRAENTVPGNCFAAVGNSVFGGSHGQFLKVGLRAVLQ